MNLIFSCLAKGNKKQTGFVNFGILFVNFGGFIVNFGISTVNFGRCILNFGIFHYTAVMLVIAPSIINFYYAMLKKHSKEVFVPVSSLKKNMLY